jgi:hypothetical protein
MGSIWLRRLGAAWVALLAAAGAAAQTALVADGYEPAYMNHTFFVVVAVDGQEVQNALAASLRASTGLGSRMRYVPIERALPAGKRVTLKLRGTEANPAPIHGLFRSMFGSGTPEVSGNVEVELQPERRYRVNGALDAFRREVWIEDIQSGAIVGAKVAAPADPQLVKAMEGAVYVSTNLRYDGDWIDDQPLVGAPVVPVGARLKVIDYRKQRANVLIDGRKMRIGVEYGKEAIEALVARLTSAEDPRARLAAWPADVRAAVASARVVRGMTREQVAAALGRPRPDLVPDEAADWPYETKDGEAVRLGFDADGRLARIDAPPRAMALLVAEPAAATAADAAAPAAASAPP